MPLDGNQRVAEILMMGLRLAEGVPADRFRALTGRDMDDVLDARRAADLVDEGLLDFGADGIAATAAGRQRLNALLAHLLG